MARGLFLKKILILKETPSGSLRSPPPQGEALCNSNTSLPRGRGTACGGGGLLKEGQACWRGGYSFPILINYFFSELIERRESFLVAFKDSAVAKDLCKDVPDFFTKDGFNFFGIV